MGLKDLKSNLDLLGGFGNEGGTLGDMENFKPTGFQKGTAVPGGTQNSPHQDLNIDVTSETPQAFQRELDVADQAHKSSLALVPGGDSNSPFQDLDGNKGPQFQKPTDIADQVHKDSLQEVPGGSQSSPFQDLDGEPGPQFQKGTDVASQAHVSSLAVVPGGSQSSPFQDRNNGATPGQYVNNMPN